MAGDELLEAVRFLPDRVRDVAVAASDLEGLPAHDAVDRVAVIGVGGGRVAADVIESLAELVAGVPVVATGGRCPRWAGPTTLALVISTWGADQPTLAAVDAARAAGASLVAVVPAGPLEQHCRELGVAVVVADTRAGPAAGLGVTLVPALVLLERLGIMNGVSRAISATAHQLETRRAALAADRRLVEGVAADLPGRVAVVGGAGAIGKHAARRWVQRLDRAAGIPSVRRRLPTDAVDAATWHRLHEHTSGGVAAIVLRHGLEPPGSTDGLHLLGTGLAAYHEIRAEGEGALAQLLDLLLIGDAVAATAHGLTGRGDVPITGEVTASEADTGDAAP